MQLLSHNVSCPYCGESIELLIDDSVDQQDYYEDCSVCCRPILVRQQTEPDGTCMIMVLRDDE